MSGESSSRSNLVDVTYQQLHSLLAGHLEGVNLDQLTEYLNPRQEQLKNATAPFGKPSDASRKKVDSGSVKLPDGVVLRVEDADKEFIFAISSKFQIDEINALILLRSFLYNEGLPSTAEPTSTSSMVAELLDAITPFYYSERLSLYRVLIPLFRGKENPSDAIYEVASEFMPKLLPDGPKFAESIVDEYLRKTNEKLPEALSADPRGASQWAKQNLKEQLVLLEVLFWTMWGFVSCSGPLVVKIYEAGYATDLGSSQRNTTLLLDEESSQIYQDCAALWILVMVEVLELESMGQGNLLEALDDSDRKDLYVSSPESLKRIHELVTTHSNGQYVCTYLAWAYVLSRLSAITSSDIRPEYQSFLDSINPSPNRSYPKDGESTHLQMTKICLEPENNLFALLSTLLTNSPLFVTAVAWRTGSTVTDPNAIAFRSVIKGLLICLVELIPVELIPDFDALVEVWIALFGRSESESITGICTQFWQTDWHHGIARRAILDVARSRFPIQVKPLLRLLRAMTAAGFLDTDPLSTSDLTQDRRGLTDDQETCDHYVLHYLLKLPTYSQVVPINACTGAHALYERQSDRNAPSNIVASMSYVNLRPIKLPGGSTLPARSTGHLLSGDGNDYVVICWQHEHNGWKLILELLTEYTTRKRMAFGSAGDLSFGKRGQPQIQTFRLEDIGNELDSEGDETVVTDALDLLRSLIQDNIGDAEQLMQSLEFGDPVVAHTVTESQPPDLVQLTTMILEEALSRSNGRGRTQSQTRLITSAMSVLSALLALPAYSNRVWLYIRSTSVLFGSDKTNGYTSSALAVERATGHYTMTLALLHLVQKLFREAISSVLPDNLKLQQLKEEVLLRAARFIHTEIWVEHLSWKYAQLGDRFEIGKRVTSFFAEVFEYTSPSPTDRPYPVLCRNTIDVLLLRATTSTINPLVSSISSGGHILRMLYSSRRFGDARRLIFLLESHLRLCRLVLNYKQKSQAASKPSLLEQSLCSRITGGATSYDATNVKFNPIDVLAGYIKDRDVGSVVPLEATRVLSALCLSLSSFQPSPPTIVGHLSNPESTVASLVRIVQHPYDDLSLRNAIWHFITLAVDKEPAIASLFVTGKFHSPSDAKGKGKSIEAADKLIPPVALDVARDALANWSGMWTANPQLLSSVFEFLDVVWQHGLEHKVALTPLSRDSEFWGQVVSVAVQEIGPIPDYETSDYTVVDTVRHSDLHDAVSMHSYRALVKSYALHIIGLDIRMHLQQNRSSVDCSKPASFVALEPHFTSQDQLTDLLSEATPSPYSPQLHDFIADHLKSNFAGLSLDQFESQDPLRDREYGDNFVFSVPLLKIRLRAYPQDPDDMIDPVDVMEKSLHSINLNLSLAHAQRVLAESWDFLLRQVSPYFKGKTTLRSILLSISASISYDISAEKRSGDMMATIHGTRLSLLLAVVELAWFSTTDTPAEIQSFTELIRNLRGIILNEAQPPSSSFLGTVSVPFHPVLLQIAFFCAKHARKIISRPKAVHADQRLTITSTIESALNLTIEALRIVFIAARSRADTDLDRDMELLVALFEQCTHGDLTPSSTLWLAKCQETDIIRASLDLYIHIDLVGLSDMPLLLSRKQPLYGPHLLLFSMALVRNPTAAERFASDGVLSAFSNNFISAAICAGMIDVTLPELPGERSPAHLTYCSMLSIVAAVMSALGRHNHYFDAEACGFVQLYGDQISRALSWTIGDPINLPLVEEIEQVVHLFYSIAASTPTAANSNPVVNKVLRVFTTHALQLLQQLNYAITHPNHLASLLDPVTNEERAQVEKDQVVKDPSKRSLTAHLVYRLFRLSSNIVGTLIAISRADTVLLSAQDDWPIGEALIVPHSKIVLGEPASLGTLLELGNCTLDLLRELINKPATSGVNDVLSLPGTYNTPPDVRRGVLTARRNLEAIMLYSVTQLGMWLSKPEFDASAPDADVEDQQPMDIQRLDGKERRGGRTPLSLAERLRRGMTGEMAADLHSLLTKAKPLLAKSNAFVGKDSVDMTQVLIHFLHERIATPP